MKIKISSEDIRKKSKKMNQEELQQHLKNSKQGIGVENSKKQYKRKLKHKGKDID